MTNQQTPEVIERQTYCKHTEKWEEPHPCPFQADINDDTETLCRCCDACQQECADDI